MNYSGFGGDDDLYTLMLQKVARELSPEENLAQAAALVDWSPQKGPQHNAYHSEAYEIFYGGAAGGGKMMHEDSEVATPTGWKKHKDLVIGDVVCNPDGTTALITGVFPKGERTVYRITFSDGVSVIAGDGHLWDVFYYSYNIHDKPPHYKTVGQYMKYEDYVHPSSGTVLSKTITSIDLHTHFLHSNNPNLNERYRDKIIVPLSEPLYYATNDLIDHDLNAYAVGVALAIMDCVDYSRSVSCVNVNCNLLGDDIDTSTGFIRFKDTFKTMMVELGFIDSETNLNIPTPYLQSPLPIRMELAKGILDTLAYVDADGCLSMEVKNNYLTKKIQTLLRSLGLACLVKIGDVNSVKVWGNHLHTFVYNESIQKALGEATIHHDYIGRQVVNVELLETKMSCVCISVDHRNQLYITDGFVVTHNTDLLLGWALTGARKSIIFRRTYKQFTNIIDRGKAILGSSYNDYNANSMTFKNIPGKRVLELGAINTEADVANFMGRPHDFIAFDEVSNFYESMYLFLIGWNRTEVPGQRTRIISAGNPPTNTDGEWVVRRWGPWLDPSYPNKAESGEIRWFVRMNDQDIEVENSEPVTHTLPSGKTEKLLPTSRTFIPAKLEDNQYYGEEYRATLQAMPEPFRSKMLYGDFGVVFEDNPYQIVKSDWVYIARERYDNLLKEGVIRELRYGNANYGLDVAEGGKDFSALCKIIQNVVIYIQYKQEADSTKLHDWVLREMGKDKASAPIVIDANGFGSGVFYQLRRSGVHKAMGIKGSTAVNYKDSTGTMSFVNLRAYLWWSLREALDPDGPIKLALPPDPKIVKDLIMPRWFRDDKDRIGVERNEIISQRLGRSPDGAVALMNALFAAKNKRQGPRIV